NLLMRSILLFTFLFFFVTAQAQHQNSLFGSQTDTFCQGDSIEAYSLSGDSLVWYGSQLDAHFSPSTQIAFDSSAMLFARTKEPNGFGPNLLFNGNFGLGDTGFYTELVPFVTP